MDVGNQLIDNIKALLDTLKGTDQPLAEVYDSPTFKSPKYPYCFVSDSGIDSDFQDQQLNERMYAYKVWVFNEYDVDNARTSRRALRSAVDAILNKIDQQESPDSDREIAYGLANLYTVMAVMATIGETVYDEEEKMIGQVVTIRVKVTVDITSALIEGPSGIVNPGHAYIVDAANYYTRSEIDALIANQDLSNYYTASQVDTLLTGKSNTGHTHDDRYYTETEIDLILANYAPALTADQNYVTDAQLAVIANTSGINTGDQDLSGYSLTTHNHDADYVNITGDTMTGSLTIRGTANASILVLRNQDNVTVLNVGSYDGDVTIYQALIVNENGGDQDTRIEGDTDTNLLLVDASTDRVGIGISTPQTKLDVNGSLTMRGSITTTSNGNLSLVPNGAGYTIIGDAGTTSHTLNTNDDLLVSGRLEVNGEAWFDERLNIDMINTLDGFGIYRSTTMVGTIGQYADDGLHITVNQTEGLTNNNFIFTNYQWRNLDHDHEVSSANPTIFIHSVTNPDTNNTQWLSLTHNQTNGVINTGLGNLTFGQTLTSDTDSTDDLGTSSIYWANVYADKIYLNATATIDGTVAGTVTIAGNITATNLSGTNTGDQDLSGLVAKSLYDANSIVIATSDNTPIAITVAEQTLVGRITAGAITALSIAQVQTLLGLGSAAYTASTAYAAALGSDDNYVTDAEKTKLANLSGTNTGDQDLSGLLVKASNLSDLVDVATARTNLGLVAGGAGDIWVEKAGDTMTGNLLFNNNLVIQMKDSGGTARDVIKMTSADLLEIKNAAGDVYIYEASGVGKFWTTDGELGVSGAQFTINGSSGNYDTIIRGDTDTALIYVDASTDRVGIGTDTPSAKLTISGTVSALTDSASDLGISSIYWANAYVDKIYLNSTAILDGAVAGTIALTGTLTANATSIITDTTTGLKIGTGTTQKLGFFNATPIVQVVATTDLGTVLSNLGLRVAGTAYPITTSGAVQMTGTLTFGSTVKSDTDSTDDLGTSSIYWANTYTDKLFFNSTATMDGSVAGLISIVGKLSTLSNGNLSLVPNGSGYTIIGDVATTSHSFNTNDDLLVTGRLEVDGIAYFDGNITGSTSTVVTALTFSAYGGNAGVKITNTNDSATAHGFFKLTYDGMQFGYSYDSSDRYDSALYVGRAFGGGDTYVATIGQTDITSVSVLRNVLDDGSGNMTVKGNFTIADAKNIVLNTTTGTKIGTATNQKLAFYNATPIVQVVDARIDDAINSGDATTDGVIDAMRDALISYGLIAAA